MAAISASALNTQLSALGTISTSLAGVKTALTFDPPPTGDNRLAEVFWHIDEMQKHLAEAIKELTGKHAIQTAIES